MPVLEVKSLSKSYAERPILRGVSFNLNQGERVALLGPSGSGKTTLLTLIAGLRDVQQGQLYVLGHELHGATRDELVDVRRKIGFIFQSFNLIGVLSAGTAFPSGPIQVELYAARVAARGIGDAHGEAATSNTIA